jgi:hypothetical protein
MLLLLHECTIWFQWREPRSHRRPRSPVPGTPKIISVCKSGMRYTPSACDSLGRWIVTLAMSDDAQLVGDHCGS